MQRWSFCEMLKTLYNKLLMYKWTQYHASLQNTYIYLKCLYYAFWNITFHAVCHVAVCEHKLSAKLWSWKRMIYKVIVY